MIEITREQANEILREASRGPKQQCTIAYGGKWYDVRGMGPKEIEVAIAGLLGIKPEEVPGKSMDIDVSLHQAHCRAGLGYVCSCVPKGSTIEQDL